MTEQQANALETLQWRNARQPPNTSMHHGGDFGRYMELKNQKLHEQFAEDQARVATSNLQRSNIFQGITIHVNGLTSPTHQVRPSTCGLDVSLHVHACLPMGGDFT